MFISNDIHIMAKTSNYVIKKVSVFVLHFIAMEYTHLMKIPEIALLVASDNSATGVPLVGGSEEI